MAKPDLKEFRDDVLDVVREGETTLFQLAQGTRRRGLGPARCQPRRGIGLRQGNASAVEDARAEERGPTLRARTHGRRRAPK